MKTMHKINLRIVLVFFTINTTIAKIHNVLDYGVKGEGIFENAQSIQKAIDEASAVGGGVVLFPPGEYRTATLFLKSNVTLRLDRGAKILIENVTVKHSTFVSRVCGFKIGPQTFGGFKNVHITDCHFEGATKPPATKYDPHHGVFLNIGNGGFIDGVLVENCTMRNIPSAMSVFLGKVDSEYWETYWPGKQRSKRMAVSRTLPSATSSVSNWMRM